MLCSSIVASFPPGRVSEIKNAYKRQFNTVERNINVIVVHISFVR